LIQALLGVGQNGLTQLCKHQRTEQWKYKKGVPSAVGFPHCAGSGEGLSLSPKPYPHK